MNYDPYKPKPNEMYKPTTFYDPQKTVPITPKPVTINPISPLSSGQQIMNQINPPIHKPLI